MNLEQLSEIRTSIDNAIAHLRCDCPEATSAALQTHLDALLKEELRALTGQAPERNLAAEFVAAELGRVKGALQRDDALGRAWVDPRKDHEPPDEWVDLPGPPIQITQVVIARTSDGKVLGPIPIGYLDTELHSSLPAIVAYKVVQP